MQINSIQPELNQSDTLIAKKTIKGLQQFLVKSGEYTSQSKEIRALKECTNEILAVKTALELIYRHPDSVQVATIINRNKNIYFKVVQLNVHKKNCEACLGGLKEAFCTSLHLINCLLVDKLAVTALIRCEKALEKQYYQPSINPLLMQKANSQASLPKYKSIQNRNKKIASWNEKTPLLTKFNEAEESLDEELICFLSK